MSSLSSIILQANSQGYFFDKRPYKLNVVGVRNPTNTSPLKFEDEIAYFYYDDNGNLVGNVGVATTSPSIYFLENPINSKGAGILKQGQYKDAYSIGLHNGLYEALVQKKPVTVIRDADRNSIINLFAPTQTGLFGINIHRATAGKNDTSIIGRDSAGCQVFENVEDFDAMMDMAYRSKDMYGNTFTYTLIDQKNVITNYTLIGALVLGIGAYIYYLKRKKIF
jgi:hypothetical protein